MKFSVITVTYNAGDKLVSTIKNILKQSYEDIEVIVKDGGSKDGSLSKVKALASDKVFIYEEPDKGIYDAMNQAVKKATGDYVIFVNAGDEFYSENILERVAAHKLPTKNTIAYGDTYFALSATVSKAAPVITGSVCYRNIPCHQAILYSRDTLLERGFDISYRIRADFEHFAYSYFTAKRNFIYLGFPICYYEGGGYSEKKSNRSKDRLEYKRAVKANIPLAKRFFYRLTLILTFHKLRGALARNPKTAGAYQSVKNCFYKLMHR